ncbi:hypothetical protein BN2476_750097 [Paraburkholderia piptadeniae]|uniref:Uncharacterized protein n=1 Tax=Paraburkholderia piptadeniae TaxID=1701573 RepID=A0A1N7SRR7_9BURK|nr:hypothetical protein BN2476_750097 [Paraburkholderia piptadeniae]
MECLASSWPLLDRNGLPVQAATVPSTACPSVFQAWATRCMQASAETGDWKTERDGKPALSHLSKYTGQEAGHTVASTAQVKRSTKSVTIPDAASP